MLRSIPDVSSLVDICVQLRKPPTEENKFLHESDRQDIVTMASTYLNTGVKAIVKNVDIEKERRKPTETLEIYKLFQKLQKTWPGKEKDVLVHMKELFALVKGREDRDRITDGEVVKFCALEASKARAAANPGQS